MDTQKSNAKIIEETLSNKEKVPVVYSVEKPEFIVCEMCGHKNPEKTAICNNCSNYISKIF